MSKNTPIEKLKVNKSNDMISAKFKSSLLENQVMAIALGRIEESLGLNGTVLEAKFYPGELKRLVSDQKHIYRDLKTLATTITGHNMFLEDGKGNFKAFSVVPTAKYEDGVFTIKFNEEIRDHIYGLEKNYTQFELGVLTDFKSVNSFRIYEALKKDLYKSNKNINEGRVDIEYEICEFKFMIGLANSDDERVKKAAGKMGKNINWEELYNLLEDKDRKYKKPSDLKKYVLEPAQAELKEKSDIYFEFEFIATRGKKIDKILFHFWPQEIIRTSESVEREEYINKINEPFRQNELPLDQYPEIYDKYVGHNNLCIEDITLLLQKANFDVELFERAISAADEQAYLTNYMGWIISYLKAGGYDNTSTIYGSHDRAVYVEENMAAAEKKKELYEPMYNALFKPRDIKVSAAIRIMKLADYNEYLVKEAFIRADENNIKDNEALLVFLEKYINSKIIDVEEDEIIYVDDSKINEVSDENVDESGSESVETDKEDMYIKALYAAREKDPELFKKFVDKMLPFPDLDFVLDLKVYPAEEICQRYAQFTLEENEE